MQGMTARQLELRVLGDHFAICRLDADSEVPNWANSQTFLSLTRTTDELSVVCPERDVPSAVGCQRSWRCIKVSGPLDFEQTGVLSALVRPLAREEISVFTMSTYDTDYLLVQDKNLASAIDVLRRAGHSIGPCVEPQ